MLQESNETVAAPAGQQAKKSRKGGKQVVRLHS